MMQRLLSFMIMVTTTYLFRFLLQGLNKVRCQNHQGLLDAIFDRGDQGLLTVSNHCSVYDDPGLWAALVPIWRTRRGKMRWSMCTDDIYNANPLLRAIFRAGKTLPVKRTRGMEQPYFKVFFDKLEQGDWGHIFAEGAIRQPWRFSKGEPLLSDFRAGIGRLLLRSKKLPMVLPMYHIGMHRVAPEAPVQKHGRGKLVKIIPNLGQEVRVYVGEPIDVRPIVEKCRAKIGDVRHLPWTLRSSKEEVECHKEIASFVRDQMLKLEAMARTEYYGSDSYYSITPEEQKGKA